MMVVGPGPLTLGGWWFEATTQTIQAFNCIYLSFSFPGETAGKNRHLLELCRLGCFSLTFKPEAGVQQAVEQSS